MNKDTKDLIINRTFDLLEVIVNAIVEVLNGSEDK